MEDKKDYFNGLAHFMILSACFISCISLSDGDIILYKLMGLFSINPGISTSAGTFYIYALVPILIGVYAAKRTLSYWWDYGARFKAYSFFLYYLPLFIIVAILLLPLICKRF